VANALPTNEVVRPRKRKRNSRWPSGPARTRSNNGAEGDRTPDLCDAIAALSQLSYGPLRLSQSSLEIELVSPEHFASLIVPTRLEPEVEAAAPGKLIQRNEVAPIQFPAVGSHSVNFVNGVRLNDLMIPAAPSAIAADEHDVVQENSPLALHATRRTPRSKTGSYR
jgi:hypothetical protein